MSGEGQVVGCCKHGYELSDSVKGGEFLEYLKECSEEGLRSMDFVT
jgi:hypothetical protein